MPGRDGNETPGVRAAQRGPLGWAETFPAPRHNVCKYRRPLMAGPPEGTARGAPRAPPVLGEMSRARSPPPSLAVPHRCPMAPQMVGPRRAGAAHRLCQRPRRGSQGSGERRGGMSPLNAHHAGADSPEIGLSHPVWAALHLHLWGPCWAPRRIQPTQTRHLTLRLPPSRASRLQATRQAPPPSCCSVCRNEVAWPTLPGSLEGMFLGRPGPPPHPAAPSRCPEPGPTVCPGLGVLTPSPPTPPTFPPPPPPGAHDHPETLPTPPRGHPPCGSPSRR